MTQFLFANNASTTLASAVAPTDTAIHVVSGTGALFPSPAGGQQFAMTFQDAATGLIEEITYCTARSGDTLTVVRGQEGTVARGWAVGDDFSNYWTSGSANAFVQLPTLQAQATNFAYDTGSPNAMAASLNPAIVAYSQITGAPIRIFKGSSSNSGNVTLTLNGLGPLPVVLPGGAQIPANMLNAYSIMQLVFDGSVFELTSIGAFSAPGGPAGGSLTGYYPNPTILANAVNNGMLAQMPPLTYKGNPAGGYGNPQDVPISTLLADLGITWGSNYLKHGTTLIQWGTISVSSGAGTVNLPIAYANTGYAIVLTPQVSGIGGAIANAEPPNVNGFAVNGSLAGSGGPANFTCGWHTAGVSN